MVKFDFQVSGMAPIVSIHIWSVFAVDKDTHSKSKTCYIDRTWYLNGHEYFWVDCRTGKIGKRYNYEEQAIWDAKKHGYKIVRKNES